MATAAQISAALKANPRQFFTLIALSSPNELRAGLGGIVADDATEDEMVNALMQLVENQDYQSVFEALRATPINPSTMSPEAAAAVKAMAQSGQGLRSEAAGSGNWWENIKWADVGKGAGDLIAPILCLFMDCPPPVIVNNNPNPNPNPPEDKKDESWSTGTIIAVVVGGLLFLGLLVGGIYWATKGSKKD